MDKTVKVVLSPSGIEQAISEIQAYQDELNALNRRFVRTLADTAAQTVDTHFPGGKTMGEKGIETGSNPSHTEHIDETSSTKTRAAADMVVEGPDLLFIEFGSGVHYNGEVGSSPHPLGGQFGYTIGSYGMGQGQYDVWGYQGNGGTVLTYGTPANKPVYDAYLDLKSRWQSIAHSVFG